MTNPTAEPAPAEPASSGATAASDLDDLAADHGLDLPPVGPGEVLLEVTDLHTTFASPRGPVQAVRGVSFGLVRGRTLGVVGESGSGKSVLSRSLMGLMPSNATRTGSVRYAGTEILSAPPKTMRKYWGDQMSMVFQDPMTALNPVMRIEQQITESLHEHIDMSKSQASDTALQLLESVGIPEAKRRLRQYPHEMSGGMRQRIMIAIALACGPKLLFADEPTTALDVTVQAQILDLLQVMQRDRQMAMILVTHDLGVVAGRAHDIAVMYAGQLVEVAPAEALFAHVRHPYTEALLRSIPKLNMAKHTTLDAIGGRPPDLSNLPPGCKFAPRCPYAQQRCLDEEPALLPDPADPEHVVACHFPVSGVSAEVAGVDAAAESVGAKGGA
ncbi:ABC transporter ATP-binding protein [soil metagenome]